MSANIDQVAADATAIRGELHALQNMLKVMTPDELVSKLADLAAAADNLAEHAKEVQRQAEQFKEY